MFCQKCNTGPFSDGKFCASCGAPLVDTSVITQSPGMPAQTQEPPYHSPAQSIEPSPQPDIIQPIETPPQSDVVQPFETSPQPDFTRPDEPTAQPEPAQTAYPQQPQAQVDPTQPIEAPQQTYPAQPAYPQQHGYGYPPSPQTPDQAGGAEPIGAHPQYPAQPAYPQQHGYGYPPSQQAYPQADPSQAAYNPYGYYPPPPPPEKPKKKLLKILVPVAGALVLLIGVAVALFLVFRGSPAATVVRAFANTGNELSERVEDTPLELFGLLIEAFADGSTTLGFEYSDISTDFSGQITFHSNESQDEYAIEIYADITLIDESVNLDALMTRETIAARISQIDNNFYGIYFDTFANDFRSFASLLNLDRQQVEDVTNGIDMFYSMMNLPDESDELLAEYIRILIDAIDLAEVSSENVDFMSGDNSIRARRLEFVFNYSLVFDILAEYIDVLEGSEYLRSSHYVQDFFSTLVDPWHRSTTYDELIREMRDDLRTAQRDTREGDLVISMYISRDDRLLRVELDLDFEVNREQTRFEMSIDFGTSAHDAWVIEASSSDDFADTTFKMVWEVNETARGGETILRVSVDHDLWGGSTYELILDWTDRGDFTLSSNEDGRRYQTLSTGRYTSDGESFNLVFDNLFDDAMWGSLHFEISTTRRNVDVERVDFINISEWRQPLIDSISNLFLFEYLGMMADLPALVEPIAPPEPAPSDRTDTGLIGVWEFSHGRPTYFFWESEFVYFAEGGFVMADDSFGNWSIDGNTLTVIDTFNNIHEVFTFEITGDILAITDRDNDTGYFVFLFD